MWRNKTRTKFRFWQIPENFDFVCSFITWHNLVAYDCSIKGPYINAWYKNAAKQSRQHAGKRYREYARRRVCFVNEQVPWPHSNINVKFCTSHLCMKMSSFLFVRAWAMLRILYLSCGVPFPVWTPDNISGLISVVLWLLRWEVIKTFQVIFS